MITKENAATRAAQAEYKQIADLSFNINRLYEKEHKPKPVTRLTAEQLAAKDGAFEALVYGGDSCVAIVGDAGTGKSVTVGEFQLDYCAAALAKTNKAVAVLLSKGVKEPKTVDAALYVPLFAKELNNFIIFVGKSIGLEDQIILEYLNDYAIAKDGDAEDYDNTKTKPTLNKVTFADAGLDIKQFDKIKEFITLETYRDNGSKLPHFVGFLLRELGKDESDYIIGKVVKGALEGEDSLVIVDEASMLNEPELEDLISTFGKVLLVGDEKQLQPIEDKDKPRSGVCSLGSELVQSRFEITEILRQKGEGKEIAMFARSVYDDFDIRSLRKLPTEGPVRRGKIELAKVITGEAPIITWMNRTRQSANLAVRHELGFGTDTLKKGEPVICKTNLLNDKGRVVIPNNALLYVSDIIGEQRYRFIDPIKQRVDEDYNHHNLYAHTYKDDRLVFPDKYVGSWGSCIPVIFGYSITCHSAQGGEYDTIYVHIGSAIEMWGRSDGRYWLYTAITRAAKEIVFVDSVSAFV
jgi:hypothetical protein